MTRDRLLLVAVGSALIGLMIALASFSLGVYVGVRGWTAGPPQVAGPGQVPPQAPAPADGAGVAPAVETQPLDRPREPLLVGPVRSVGADTITVNTAEGPRLCRLAPDVEVVRATGDGGEVPASLDDVRRGVGIAVFGRLAGDGARQLIAHRLVLLPPR
jgi:hypothetical protein